MRLGTIGKRQFAFGLQWTELHDRVPAELAREALGTEIKGVYTTVKNKDDLTVVGYAETPEGGPSTKGALYSYAAALTAIGKDGIYVAPVNVDRLWYVVIADGLVVPGTDQVLEVQSALTAVASMRSSFDLPVYVADDAELAIADAQRFNTEQAIAKAKVKPLRRLAQSSQWLGIVLLILVLVGIGFGAWYLFSDTPQEVVGPSAQEQAAELRAAYLVSVRGAVSTHPATGAWVTSAYRTAVKRLPPVIAGWRLEGVTCTPNGCSGTYVAVIGQPRAIAPVIKRFGKSAVAMLSDNNSMTVKITTPPVKRTQWTDNQILTPLPWPRAASDVAGRLPLYFADIALDGRISVVNLNTKFQAPLDANPLARETIAIKQASALEITQLNSVAAYFAQAGFVATALAASGGTGETPSAWRLEFQRLGGVR